MIELREPQGLGEGVAAQIVTGGRGRWRGLRELYRRLHATAGHDLNHDPGPHMERGELYCPRCARADPYWVDWSKVFTPIEYAAWIDIRRIGMPVYPQYPAGRFFLDFGDPFRKIAIECDGKQFHNAERDAARDRELGEIGWTVYRMSGAECYRVKPDGDETDGLDDTGTRTSTGILEEIWRRHYAWAFHARAAA